MAQPSKNGYSFNFVGDVMLGRKIDQLFPNHVEDPSARERVQALKQTDPSLQNYNHASPWGTTLPLLHSAALNFINLENAITSQETPYPGKNHHFRMHATNANTLRLGNISFASVANNHTLDFRSAGFSDTMQTLARQRIAYAGGSPSTVAASRRPAVLDLPPCRDAGPAHTVCAWAYSDNEPEQWVAQGTFCLLEYTQRGRAGLKAALGPDEEADFWRGSGALRVFSVHWGPNYAWRPGAHIVDLAHFLVDECAVDIVHGHSAHHVQGVELYKGKLIIYGCGDLVDDFEPDEGMEEFRSKLGAVWRVNVVEDPQSGGLQLDTLEVFPTRIESFRAMLLEADDEDHGWVRQTITRLSVEMGTVPRVQLGEQGQLVFDL